MTIQSAISAAGLLGFTVSICFATATAQTAKPPVQVKVTNGRTVPVVSLEIATPGEQPRLIAKLTKPLAPGKSIALKLNKPAGCSYSVLAKFGDEVESDNEGVDLCRERSIRLTD
ncbi:hypothetical protein [Bosea sp. BIWAKO-01]|uniref:hypothetical protein n=1 Tax=Bosea sp. BIWAKO-01 TaxID=506668 RepID=UPI000852E188|nr:hypothetical protein [Bosea sp. BIWAKO-01]GAU87004.1 hypothetical protein BIWAKO_06957 [Bosea sp. BIWAKO-01]